MAGLSVRITRRLFGLTLLGCLPRRRAFGEVPGGRPVAERRCSYRADASIIFLVPLFRRAGVGAAQTSWREDEAGGARRTWLEFVGSSIPERAAGLNRLGLIREMSVMRDALVEEFAYFGVMTFSPEETAEEAKKALRASASGESPYVAIDGYCGAGRQDTRTARFSAPAELGVKQEEEIVERARRALSEAEAATHAPGPPAGSVGFLHALATALRQPAAEVATGFHYNGRPYRLHLTKSQDKRAAAKFADRGLIHPGARVEKVSGRLRRETGGKETSFQLWVEAEAALPLPLRIQYQPRSYLRLTFEAA